MSNVKPMSAPAVVQAKRKFALSDVKKGRQNVPLRIFGYGVEKVGKSSFAAGAPDAVFLGPDGGTPHLDIERLPSPATWEEVFDLLTLVESNPVWKTLVIDPINWLEDLVWARVVDGPNSPVTNETRNKIEKHGGGYAKGYEAAVSYWRVLTRELEANHYAKGRHVVLMAHAQKKPFADPVGATWDRYEVKMHQKAAGLLKEWADDVLFFRHEVLAKQEGAKTLAVSTDERIVHTVWSKAWDAGNRSGLPDELPMAWEAYWGAVESGRALIADIEALLKKSDADTRRRAELAFKAAMNNRQKLTAIRDALVDATKEKVK